MTRKHRNLRSSHQHSGAFTLIEIMLAAAIIAIIMVGMQSAMVLASRAAPDRKSGNTAAVLAGQAMDQISADLTYATSITTATANTIEFTVPDRNGDGSPETIRYSWSGVSGAPLLRTVNGGSAISVASNITEFQLIYDKRSQQRSTTYTESGEVLLSSNDGINPFYLGDATIDSNNWFAQYFRPTLTSGATQWRVTRVKFKARTHGGNSGITRVQMRTVVSSAPGAVIEEGTLLESNLSSSYSWQEFAFSTVSGRTPGTGLFFTLQWANDAQSCDVQYQYTWANVPNAVLSQTYDAGADWYNYSGRALIFYAYGTYSTPNPSASDYWLTGVRCTLRSGTDPQARLKTSVRVLNEPQVSGP